MARKPQLTAAGLLAESFGRRPYVVTLREEKAPGTNVLLDFTLEGGVRRKPSLGYPVRAQQGRKWEWDDAALERAREAAEDKSAELRLARMRVEVLEAHALTFQAALDLYLDPERGGLPRDKKTRLEYTRRLRRWGAYFGASRPWNAIRPSEVQAWARKRQEQGKVPDALASLDVLRTLHRWLTRSAAIQGLQDPLAGLNRKALKDSHTPARRRYSPEELAELVRVRHDVDPRFALYLALMDDSGARSKALRILWRSALDARLDSPPSPEEAPHGWLVLPALKGQRAPLALLTAFQRREIDLALDGYLAELEARWRSDGADYPLFPGARLGDKRVQVVGVGQPGALRPASPKRFLRWLYEAEGKAGVRHIPGRSYHGIRRAVSDLLYDRVGLDALTTGMGWSTRSTPEQIYVDQRRMKDRVRVREELERRRETDGES